MSNIAGINNRPPTDVVDFAQDTHEVDTSTCVQDEPNLFLSYEKSNIVAIKLSNRLGVDETESIPADQKACLIRYLNDWEKEISKNGPKDYDIATLSNKLAKLTKAGINLLPLEECLPAQRKSIVMYVSQMLECGYKVSFANDVCEMMSKLYQYTTECDGKSVTIEDVLSSMKADNIKNDCRDSGNFHTKFFGAIDKILVQFMSENGGDYQIVKDYLEAHGSCAQYKLSVFFKAFCYSTRANLEKENYFSLDPDEKIKIHREDEKLHGDDEDDGEDDDKDVYRGSYDPMTLSKIFSEYDSATMSKLFFDKVKIPDKEKYIRSMTMNRAFVAVALNCMDFPDLDKDSYMIKVFRSSADEIKQPGVADSCSLCGNYYIPWHYSYSGYYLLEAEVPICDVYAAYPLNEKLWSGGVNEMICNFINFKEINRTSGLDSLDDEIDKEVENAA